MTSGAPAKRWLDLRKRFLSALLLGPSVLLCIWLGAEPWTGLVALAAAILSWEWVRLCGLKNRGLPGAAVPVVVMGAAILAVFDARAAALLVLLGGTVLAYALGRMGAARPPQIFALGILYIGVACLSLVELRYDNEAGRANTLFLFMVVWASDIGAYMAGRAIGGPKLWPAVSPNKTWSGSLGGLALAMVVGLAVSQVMAPGGALRAALIAVLLGVASQAGDLLESAVKRRFHVKDTSALIPGHGGLLDRLDGLIAAAPVATLIALALGPGQPLWR